MFGSSKGLGQQVVYGKPANQYSKTSARARPFPCEDSLLATGQTQPIDTPLHSRYLGSYGAVPPPPIPYIDDEKERLLAEHNRVLWPHEDTYSYALGNLTLGQDLPSWIMGVVTPKNAWAWVVGGGALIALAQSPKIRKTWASGVITGGGGIVLGMGLLPLVMKIMSKKKETP